MTATAFQSCALTLRPYQAEAVDAIYTHLRAREDNPLVVIPTGGGKTPVMAKLCSDAVTRWNGRVLILSHVKELIEQTAGTLGRMAPQLRVGLFSAGLNRRDTNHPVIVAGIQSVFRRAAELDAFNLIIIDEAHMIPPEGDGMYQTFLREARIVNPHLRVIGLTATPYRMTSGMICQPDHFLNHICFQVGVKELIRDGYLCPLRTKGAITKADTSKLHIRGGEFVAGETEDLMDQDHLVRSACEEIVQQTLDRQSVLIFASGVQHGEHIVQILQQIHGVECGFVTGDTPAAQREAQIARFRRQGSSELFGKNTPLKYLCNVNVLTTGFDAPNVDCVVMLRPTNSPGLYYQMVGRGFRLCEGKSDCLVLDFGGNVLRHGPVDAISVEDPSKGTGDAPAKECPQCHALIATGYANCPNCGHAFPPPETSKHEATASADGILSGQVTLTDYPVSEVFYSVHTKRDAPPDHPRTLRAEYQIGWRRYKSEWICLEHPSGSYARAKAESWWRLHSSDPPPTNVDEAVAIAQIGGLANTTAIQVRSVAGEKYDRIVDHTLGEIPPATGYVRSEADESDLPPPAEYSLAEDEIPF